MKKLLTVFFALLFMGSACGGSYTAPAISPIGIIPRVGVPIPPGYIGEVLDYDLSSVPGSSLVSGVAKNLITVSVTPGIWLTSGYIGFTTAATTSVTARLGSTSFTSSTLIEEGRGFVMPSPAQVFGVVDSVFPIRTMIDNATTGNIPLYLNAQANFTVSTVTAFGHLTLYRIR